tara:strand:+ start:339 stop:1262 length:924 start_codon:yes stop_codon:yes gene_type:complete
MKVLITGASGLLGGRLAEYLHSKKIFELVMLTRNAKENAHLNKYGSVINVNWEDQDQLNKVLKNIDIVLHSFGPSAQKCADDPDIQISSYIKYTKNLLQAINKNTVMKAILLSSIHVYSRNLKGNISEEDDTTNDHPYALSKLGVERIFKRTSNSNTKYFILRLSNCFGYPVGRSKNCWDLFVNNICRESIKNNLLSIQNNPYIKRDFLPISYLCEVLESIMNNNIKEGLYNLTSGETRELLEFSEYIKNIIDDNYNTSIQIKYNKSHKKMNSFVLENEKLASQLPKILINYEEEIRKLYIYCRDKF